MADENSGFSDILLDEIRRQGDKLDKLIFKQIEQTEVLTRNTVSLEEHIKRTNLLEDRTERIENEVMEVQDHVRNVKNIFGILKPTKEKLKWITLLVGLIFGGHFGVKELSKIDKKQNSLENKQEVIIEKTIKDPQKKQKLIKD